MDLEYLVGSDKDGGVYLYGQAGISGKCMTMAIVIWRQNSLGKLLSNMNEIKERLSHLHEDVEDYKKVES